MCVCVLSDCFVCGHTSRRSVTSQRQLLVGYGMYRARSLCVCLFLGEGLAVWVLLSRVDGRRADRSQFGSPG